MKKTSQKSLKNFDKKNLKVTDLKKIKGGNDSSNNDGSNGIITDDIME